VSQSRSGFLGRTPYRFWLFVGSKGSHTKTITAETRVITSAWAEGRPRDNRARILAEVWCQAAQTGKSLGGTGLLTSRGLWGNRVRKPEKVWCQTRRPTGPGERPRRTDLPKGGKSPAPKNGRIKCSSRSQGGPRTSGLRREKPSREARE